MKLPRFLYPLKKRQLVRQQVNQMECRPFIEVFQKKKDVEEKLAEHLRKAQRLGQQQKHFAEIEQAKLDLINWLFYGSTNQ